jgi:hypothetical protein
MFQHLGNPKILSVLWGTSIVLAVAALVMGNLMYSGTNFLLSTFFASWLLPSTEAKTRLRYGIAYTPPIVGVVCIILHAIYATN